MTIDSASLQNAVAKLAGNLSSIETELNAADAKLGDGDTGGMLARVIGAMHNATVPTGADVGLLLSTYAKATAGATGSSLGTLLATAILTISKQTKGRNDVPWSELGGLLEIARDAMSARGGASLGDKTILDAIDAVATSIDGLDNPVAVHAAAKTAANSALVKFKDQPNKIGRARMFADGSKGFDDPGMLAMLRIIETIGR